MRFDPSEFNVGNESLKDISLDGSNLRINAKLDVDTFVRIYKDNIFKQELTPEKAFYIVLTNTTPKQLPTVSALLTQLTI